MVRRQIIGTLALYVLLPVLAIWARMVSNRADEVTSEADVTYVPASTTPHITPRAADPKDPDPAVVVAYAKSLKGIPYKYACADPARGFDCSGFVQYVFHHFDIHLPRSSADFAEIGTPVSLSEAKPGDLILFTGTNSNNRSIGHVGIITHTRDSIVFIHASSGKAAAITESSLSPHYRKRFVKTVEVLG